MSPKIERHSTLSGTELIHGDDEFAGQEVSAPISVSTTFRYPSLTEKPLSIPQFLDDPRNPSRHIYSRFTQNVTTRVEEILSRINDGYAITFPSGLAASYVALVFYKPKRIAIRGGYHGFHNTIEVYKKTREDEFGVIDIDDEFQAGDLCWLETPLNPTGESRDIKYYADKVHAAGGNLIVDSTFGPPPLQYPFKWGADIVLHSATKYFGGHSDLLAGVLIVKTLDEWKTLWRIRSFHGTVIGSLESWLLLRSLRTLHLRVARQSATATALAGWLKKVSLTPIGESYDGIPGGVLVKVWHSSLQEKDARGFEPKHQMEGGWNATFAFLLGKKEYATLLPHVLKYFVSATSLGGVESLIEHRIQSDASSDPCLLRISVGVEEFEDLKNDLRQGLQEAAKQKIDVKL